MTKEEFDEILEQTNAVICNREWYERAIKALETLEEFEKAQIITGGRLNGRTYAYKCGLEDGKRKALEQEPTTKENLVVGDCISRKQAMKACYQMAVRTGIEEKPYKYAETELAHLPSIQPKPKTGHWIIKEGREQGYDIAGIKTWYIQIMCDKCGFIKTAIEGHTGQYHFCPNCGAKMESEDKE